MDSEEEVPYSNIRQTLGPFIGQRLIDISQHDKDEFAETKKAYVLFLFEGGDTITVPITDEGLDYSIDDPNRHPEWRDGKNG